jgi:hypothetical protein
MNFENKNKYSNIQICTKNLNNLCIIFSIYKNTDDNLVIGSGGSWLK